MYNTYFLGKFIMSLLSVSLQD